MAVFGSYSIGFIKDDDGEIAQFVAMGIIGAVKYAKSQNFLLCFCHLLQII